MRFWRIRQAGKQDPFEELRGLADGLETAVFLLRKNGGIVYANQRAKLMFGFPNLEGKTMLQVTLSHNVERLAQRALETGERQADELQLRGQEDMIVVARAWPDASHPGYAYLTLLDVTGLRRLERVRQDFVANVSHELKTPLTTVRAMAEILTDVDSEDEALRTKYLRQIQGEVDRLSLVVDDLLALSLSESVKLRKEPCDLVEILENVVTQLSPKAKERGIQLSLEGPSKLELEANPTQISQVGMNLVDNALNYTAEGQVVVRMKTEGDLVEFEVADTGLGIPSEDLPRVFERFYRVDKSRSRASGGTGLGLSIVKHIVEAHGGQVSVESTLNRGSAFRVSLPVGDLS